VCLDSVVVLLSRVFRSVAKRNKPHPAVVGLVKDWKSRVPGNFAPTNRAKSTIASSTQSKTDSMSQFGGVSDNDDVFKESHVYSPLISDVICD
jgi:hypothetical protein